MLLITIKKNRFKYLSLSDILTKYSDADVEKYIYNSEKSIFQSDDDHMTFVSSLRVRIFLQFGDLYQAYRIEREKACFLLNLFEIAISISRNTFVPRAKCHS